MSVDFLNFVVPEGDPDAIVRELAAFLGVRSPEWRATGMHGYERSVDLAGHCVVAYGGASQRGTVLVSINGSGCARVAHFRRLREWAEPLGARITRADVAGDDFDGDSLRVRDAIAALRRGLFKSSGRSPNAQFVGDLGSGDGSTLYVGARASGKLCRVYEKGKQLGDKLSKWVRAEVEFHAKDRVVPWEIVCDPVRFLAGAYPYLARFSMVAERIRTFKRSAELSLAQVVKWARLAVGRTVNVLVQEFEGDLGRVCMLLRREGVPHRLAAFRDADGGGFEPVGAT